ncbi:MAG: gspD [Hydrocarboniphaga sp.]|uniref:type II secretion system secretin GspD n=1 Tax=Hydrocarboniphaga sp. TaxID=2033016 RepID=UPI00260719CD|nr:type II secretion system secretin GspD [Hydrocarboniphaga sp.]MDB5967687.1 gspD [Hydrocarboniphaga sp.]
MTPSIYARRARAAVLLLLGSMCAVLPAWAQVTLNLKDADINTLIATVSEVTGKNFIVDPRVKGKVTVISSSPMDAAGVYETFLAVLQVQGFAAIPAGESIKIVPETNARQDGGSYNSSGEGLAIDEVVTHVYNIQNVSAAQLVPILRPLVPQWGHLAAYAPSNMLIISDRAANVVRLEKLIRQIDQSSDRDIEMVHLKNAGAADMVRTLTALTQGDKNQDPSVKPAIVLADERSNNVLVGGDKADRQKMIDIIRQLDVEIGEGGATQVYYLNYGSAENLAPILEGYAQQVNTEGKTGAAAAAPTSSGSNANGVKVLADKETNSLIITAPPKAMRLIRDVIAQLDVRRSQVLVDGIIAEVSADKSSQLGVDWAVFNGNTIAAAGILNPTTLTAIASASAATSTTAAVAGALSQGINIGGGALSSGGTTFALLLKALKGDGNTNVLSQPSLTTLDNQEAEFSVGQEVPFLTGSYSNTGTSSTSGSVNPFQTIERKDVGLTLGITPQINQGNTIKLKLKLEISSLAANSTSAVDLVTNKRTLSNTVTVEDGQILVLGGLIDDSLNDSRSGVPFISDIPLLGSLFKYRSVQRTKRNLMVFIRPAIVRTQAQGDYYTRRKYDSAREAQLNGTAGSIPLIGGTRPVMPGFDTAARDHMPASVPPPGALPGAAPPATPDSEPINVPTTTRPIPLLPEGESTVVTPTGRR